jgi:hypothetical protein
MGQRMPSVVVVLLDRRRDEARHADAVAAHDERALLLLVVDERRPHRRGVLGAEHEDVAGFDAAIARERAPVAARARIARRGEANVGDLALVVATEAHVASGANRSRWRP